MEFTHVPFDAPLAAYEAQAEVLLAAWAAGDERAVQLVWHRHPRFLDAKIPWLPRRMPESEVRQAQLDRSDARLAVARCYDFKDWPALVELVEAVATGDSPVARFEAAVEAVVQGDITTLAALLHQHPDLVRARSTRVTHFDPPVHRATLLHYLAANGVEGHRQRTPANAVAVAALLLTAGAEPDALADLYGGQCTTMSLLVSSSHPAQAGVQGSLVDVLVDFGAAVEPKGAGEWTSPLMTALVFGYRDAAEALVRHGARVDSLAAAAGLGRLVEARQLLPAAGALERHRALALAAQLGHVELVRLFLDAGEDPDRFNPEGLHSHATPLHHAALAGHLPVVRELVERGARRDLQDTIYQGTPLGWALHGGQTEVADYLRARG